MDPKNTYRHEEKIFEILESWKPADVPEFLATRILSRATVRPSKPMKWAWATLAVIILINGLAAAQYLKQSKPKTEGAYSEYLESASNIYNYYPGQS